MSALMIIGIVIAGLLNISFLVLGILSYQKGKSLDDKISHLTEKLVSNDVLQGGMQDASADRLAQRIEAEGTVHSCAQEAEKSAEARQEQLLGKLALVESHMSRYSAVLESQNRLIQAISGLTEELDSSGRRHR